ncbi:RibD family protein [Marinivivus vitaminiproducens]|uniref:RibD family protein n=1 Tax=Marinivivus vitaminiproducens TaxID=3035935 RepID=UPI0027A67CCD|nr:RibD family protein [Geminicoccaceae bacterium SCSIO 64248]
MTSATCRAVGDAAAGPACDDVWPWLLAQAGRPLDDRALPAIDPSGLTGDARTLYELFRPLAGQGGPYAIAHLGQSLDGRIATEQGRSFWVTGPEDVRHTHRLRAMSDAVLVGAGTIAADDPKLTTREVPGRHAVRVVLDTRRRLPVERNVFTDGVTETVLVCRSDHARGDRRHGDARILAMDPAADGRLEPSAVLAALRACGLDRIFIEGGGVTVSRFLEAGVLDRLQIAVAPLIIGSGRAGLSLAPVVDLAQCRRPKTRTFRLGDDILFDCDLR